MSSTALVSSYSSDEEDRKSNDVNYDQVTMDMSDDDNSDVFASKSEYEEYKAQFESNRSSAVNDQDKGLSRGNRERGKDQASKHSRTGEREDGYNRRQSSRDDDSEERGQDRKRLHQEEGEKTIANEERGDDKREDRRGHRSNKRHRHEHRRHKHEGHRHHEDDQRHRDRRHRDQRHRDDNRPHSRNREQKTFRKLDKLGMTGVSEGLKAQQNVDANQRLAKLAQGSSNAMSTSGFIPAASSSLTEQIKRRKMLWTKKASDEAQAVSTTKASTGGETSGQSGMSFNKWEETNFGNNAVNEKFRRLMGIKNATSTATEKFTTETKGEETNMFEEQEKEYERARLATHTQRGVGLGFAPNPK